MGMELGLDDIFEQRIDTQPEILLCIALCASPLLSLIVGLLKGLSPLATQNILA